MKRIGGAFLLIGVPVLAQWPGDQAIPQVKYPVLLETAKTPEAFVPKNWKIEAKVTGDLNRDGLSDAALVLHMESPSNVIATSWDPDLKYDTNPRMLVVVFARKGGGYELAAADHKLIPRLENPNQDEPFDEVKIAAGTLRVTMHLFLSAGGWRMGGSSYTFRWQQDAFRLIGFDRDSVTRNTGDTEEVSINYLTRRKHLKTGNIDGGKENERTVNIPRKPLLTLDQVGDGLLFDPDEK
jgi:hypothetical protein